MNKYFFSYLLSCALLLNITSAAHDSCCDSKKQPIPGIWRAFRGSMFLLSAFGIRHCIDNNHRNVLIELFRNLLICSLQIKGLSHIVKAITDEAYKKNLIACDSNQSITDYLDAAHNFSVLGIGAGTVGYYPTLSNSQASMFQNSVIGPWLLYLGGCIAYHLFDTKA